MKAKQVVAQCQVADARRAADLLTYTAPVKTNDADMRKLATLRFTLMRRNWLLLMKLQV